MGIFQKIRHFMNPSVRFVYLADRHFYDRMPDKEYLSRMFYARLGYNLDWDNLQTFNQKIQWIKLYDRKPIYNTIVDKYEVKKMVSDVIGEQFIISTLGVWNNFRDIDFNKLPNQFVLKCTHDSGGLVICKDKSTLNLDMARTKINESMRNNYFFHGREWAYKDVSPRIIAEEYLSDADSPEDLRDYKFYAFSGKVHFIHVDYDRFTDHHRNFYDINWKYQPFTTRYPTNPEHMIPRPDHFDQMVEAAEKLAHAIGNPAHLRVDMYDTLGGPKFGELTLYHGSGNERFIPEEWDFKMGEFMTIPMRR